jgi:signal transduction histidine kinase
MNVEGRHRGDGLFGWLPRAVARIPAPIHIKLLAAFLVIAGLLVTIGVVGLQVLGAANDRAVNLGRLEQKVAAYRQLQTEITRQLNAGSAAFSAQSDTELETIVRQLNQSTYSFDRLQFVAEGEGVVLDRIDADYSRFVQEMTTVVNLVRAKRVPEALDHQRGTAQPLAAGLERDTNELVNRAEAEVVSTIDANHDQFVTSRIVVIALAAVSLVLALSLGYAIAWSVITPVQRMRAHLEKLTEGDFSHHVTIANRDELGSLAISLNTMNDELGRLYRELATASRHKSEFLANMSHELRTPLNAVIGFSDVLREHMVGDLNEQQDDYLDDILGSGKHLLSLINDILDLSKIEAGRMDLELEAFAVGEALDNGMSMVRERALRRGVSLRLDVMPDLGEIVADERKVKQVIFNLLSNAVKFTSSGGRVDVVATRTGDEIHISVRDTGVGISAADQEHIFEEFRQAARSKQSEPEGTGLGLALARRFVELHGGRIWVESEIGIGSTFTFSLPNSQPLPGAVPSTPIEGASTGVATIEQPAVGSTMAETFEHTPALSQGRLR